MVIAGMKAVLIAWFFMELGVARTSIHGVVAVALLLFLLLVSITTIDVESRGEPPLLPPQGPQGENL
jgi:caa(3)-type oxidase subunit IV